MRPLRLRSMGLEPILHPPGRATFALPILAINGPNTVIEALILLTNS
ncbi:hypothetical protein ES703_79355 [subsurface metagenome]